MLASPIVEVSRIGQRAVAYERGRGERECVHSDAMHAGDHPRLAQEALRLVYPLRKRLPVQPRNVLRGRREQGIPSRVRQRRRTLQNRVLVCARECVEASPQVVENRSQQLLVSPSCCDCARVLD